MPYVTTYECVFVVTAIAIVLLLKHFKPSKIIFVIIYVQYFKFSSHSLLVVYRIFVFFKWLIT